ncbi:uncharacterized protein E5676_scaffold18G00960 [Cucumis melo var. makuwa]|uniref:Uncharacterized protein n=1 Tax=Cucumis melo var. makuwa TaxID=1194695 RepID=A0A5D3BTI7_CUCMM|nr:uncharacterized protein E5676_scaffold18G00960 [Cucumis melo var. makuwa]
MELVAELVMKSFIKVDEVRFPQTWLEGLEEKVGEVNALNARVDGLPISELALRVDLLKHKTTQVGSFELGSSSLSSVAHMEERIEELDYSQKTMLKLFSDLSNDFIAMIETIKTKMADMKMQVNLTMRVVGNQTPNQVCNISSRVKIPKPKAFNRNRDAKELKNFIFDME